MTELSLALDRAHLAEVARHSHAVIAGNQDPGGAYPASPTFSAYQGYAWLRDGAFTAEGMSRYGDVASVARFHDWVDRVLTSRADQVAGLVSDARRGKEPPLAAMLPTRFTFDGLNGSDPWWDFQTDGYGMWLWSVVTHARRHDVPLARWAAGITVAVDYVTAFWDRACYDWWEEHVEARHVSTLAALHGGLEAVLRTGLLDPTREAAARAASDGARDLALAQGTSAGRAADASAPHLTKWLGSVEVDGSLAACVVPFGLVPVRSPLAQATLDAVSRDLDVDGGVHRFRADVFYGGGQWLLLSCLLGWNLAVAGDRDGALRHLRWVLAHATPTGDLPEQVPDHLLHPESRQEWLDRWGPVATPLLWSHGMLLILADELGLLTERSVR
ncbi:MAG TPA: glycoside hydrolase family 15 protein [Actinotalea sp.]